MSKKRSPFHRGEQELQAKLGIRERMEQLGGRAIRDQMPDQHQEFFAQLPLLFAGTVDSCGRPWASVLAGRPGFVRAIDPQTLKVATRPIYGDPLGKALSDGADIGLLGLEFPTRRRNRANGRIATTCDESFEVQVLQSFGNCPKYIQARDYIVTDQIAYIGDKREVQRGTNLNRDQAAFVSRSDTLFIASQFSENSDEWSHGVDVSHRGGRPGFVVVAHESLLLFPDYAGNCLFNTLGNIAVNPRCGLLFIDFDTGNCLQLSGEAAVLWEPEHVCRFPGAKRVVSFQVEEVIHIEAALPLTWQFRDFSPVFDTFETADVAAPTGEPRTPMRLKSVNVSMPRDIEHAGKAVSTGIFKTPVDGRIMLRRLNLDGDGQADLWGHGGAFRAVYAYPLEHYAYWEKALGRDDFPIGQFGENFTVEGMFDDEVCVGDVFRIGGALLEVSQPRIPCYKLAIKMGVEGFQNQFLESGKVGFYFRVLEEGEVGAGDAIELVRPDARRLTVTQVSNLLFFDKENLEGTRRALQIPALSHGWKGSFQERLAKAEAPAQSRPGFSDFIVDRREPESETVTSFYMAPADGVALAAFEPGQFLTFELDIPGQDKPVIRTYSLSDAPNPECYRVSIKREPAPPGQPDVPPGLSSNYFHDQVAVGTKLRVGPPRGKFHLDQASERAVVLLSGGVGLTPMICMMNAIVRSGSQRPVWFVHGVRNGREHAMGDHGRRTAAANENVHVHICYSDPDPDDVAGRDYDSQGRIDIPLLKQLLPFDDYDFYLCGPPPFMQSLYRGLLALNVPEGRIHYEFFGPGSLLQDDAEPVGEAPPGAEMELVGGVQVAFARSGITVDWDPACETILDLAERHGLSPDYSCRSGICHTCITDLTEGEVDYLEPPLDEPGQGQVLICCARPKTSLVVEI